MPVGGYGYQVSLARGKLIIDGKMPGCQIEDIWITGIRPTSHA